MLVTDSLARKEDPNTKADTRTEDARLPPKREDEPRPNLAPTEDCEIQADCSAVVPVLMSHRTEAWTSPIWIAINVTETVPVVGILARTLELACSWSPTKEKAKVRVPIWLEAPAETPMHWPPMAREGFTLQRTVDSLSQSAPPDADLPTLTQGVEPRLAKPWAVTVKLVAPVRGALVVGANNPVTLIMSHVTRALIDCPTTLPSDTTTEDLTLDVPEVVFILNVDELSHEATSEWVPCTRDRSEPPEKMLAENPPPIIVTVFVPVDTRFARTVLLGTKGEIVKAAESVPRPLSMVAIRPCDGLARELALANLARTDEALTQKEDSQVVPWSAIREVHPGPLLLPPIAAPQILILIEAVAIPLHLKTEERTARSL